MTHAKLNASGPLVRAWHWVKDQWILEVPEADALCEFDCRKLQCLEGEWANCERRLSRASGELMPGPLHSELGSKP